MLKRDFKKLKVGDFVLSRNLLFGYSSSLSGNSIDSVSGLGPWNGIIKAINHSKGIAYVEHKTSTSTAAGPLTYDQILRKTRVNKTNTGYPKK